MKPTDSDDSQQTSEQSLNSGTEDFQRTGSFAAAPSEAEMTGKYEPGQTTEGTIDGQEIPSNAISIPGYQIEGVLGRGGMGVVYKARHLSLKRAVALKMVLAGSHIGPRERTRFRIEAEAVARLQHPNIVQIHEVGESEGHPYCALEFVAGGTLADRLNNQPMQFRDAAKLVETLARAMQLAHSRNVVHRDLKPANVLLTVEDVPKISDFGLARQLDDDSGETQAGMVMGTPSYMAPEQASGRANEAGPAADVYSLGAILYCCLTGRPPFKAKTSVETLDQVRTQEPAPPSQWQADVPLDLETICLKCLRKEPEKRYASAGELADELVRFGRGEPILGRPVGHAERWWKWAKRNPSRAAFGAASILLLVTIAASATMLALKERQSARDQSEYNLNLLAEQREKDLALRNERIGSARLALDRGIILCEQGDVARGLVAMSAGLMPAAEADAMDIDSAIRHNLAAWERELWQLQSIEQGPPGAHVVSARIQPAADVVAVALSNNTVEFQPLDGSPMNRRPPLKFDSVVLGLDFSADGRRLLIRTQSKLVVWDVGTWVEIGKTFQDEAGIWAAAISPDGGTVAAAGNSPVVRFWNPDAPMQTVREVRQSWPARLLQFLPNGGGLLTSDNDQLRRWDVRSGMPIGPSMKHDGMVHSAAYSRDGKWIVSSSRAAPRTGNGMVYLWNADGTLVRETAMDGGTEPIVQFSPDSQFYTARSLEGAVQLRRTTTGENVPNLSSQVGPISSISFDGSTLILGERNGRLRFWDLGESRMFGPILHHQAAVTCSELSSDGRLLVSVDGALRRWRIPIGQRQGRLLTHAGEVLSLNFSPNGELLVTGSAVGPPQVWSTGTGERVAQLNEQQGSVLSVAFSHRGNRVLTSGVDRIARIWRTDDWTVSARLTGHRGGVMASAFSPDGDIVLTGGLDRTARFWDSATGNQLGEALDHSAPIRAVAFRPDGQVALCGCQDGTAQLWNVATRSPVGEPIRHQAIEWVGFTADGRYAITAGYDPEVRLWDANTGVLVRGFPAPNRFCQSVAASPDSRFILAGGLASVVPLRLLETGEPVGLPLQHEDFVRAVAFAPNGKTVLTGSFDATSRRWHVPTGFPVGPAWHHSKKLRVVEFSLDGSLCASGGWDRTASLWTAPPPTEGDPMAIRKRMEQISGISLQPDGSVQALTVDGWRARRAPIAR